MYVCLMLVASGVESLYYNSEISIYKYEAVDSDAFAAIAKTNPSWLLQYTLLNISLKIAQCIIL